MKAKNIGGFSSVELLTALLIGSIVLTATFNNYLKAKWRYAEIQHELDNHSDLLLVTELLRDSIRKAGFTPCLSIKYLISNPLLPNLEINPTTNSLIINRMSENFNVVQRAYDLNLKTSKDVSFSKDQTILIADCYHAEILHISKINIFSDAQWIELSSPLIFHYQPPIYIGELLDEKFILEKKKHLSAFYYGVKRLEVLSNEIKNIKYFYKNDHVLQVELFLKNDKKIDINARIRSE